MPPNSLRLQLLGWLLGPLAVVVAVNTWAIYTNATETATVVQDRMLLGAVRIIAEQTYYKDGELHVEVPPAALELFESSSQDRVFYRVASPRGALLLGYAELPAPRDRPRVARPAPRPDAGPAPARPGVAPQAGNPRAARRGLRAAGARAARRRDERLRAAAGRSRVGAGALHRLRIAPAAHRADSAQHAGQLRAEHCRSRGQGRCAARHP